MKLMLIRLFNIILYVNITASHIIDSDYAQLHKYKSHTYDLEVYQKFNYCIDHLVQNTIFIRKFSVLLER